MGQVRTEILKIQRSIIITFKKLMTNDNLDIYKLPCLLLKITIYFKMECHSGQNFVKSTHSTLTLDFRAVGRAFEVPSWLITVFCDSISKEGKRGVPGGVRSLKR